MTMAMLWRGLKGNVGLVHLAMEGAGFDDGFSEPFRAVDDGIDFESVFR